MMDVGADMIGMVKTNKKAFFTETIDNLKNNWPGGSYLMLKSKTMLPGDSTLIAIGYKYNAWKVVYLIVIEDTGSKKAGINYLSK